ncbi:hypothetical protein [Candidatus Midichloria mitochondrii]|nr:hypothetical protein [Candidatus Midichloria mitochondrii]
MISLGDGKQDILNTNAGSNTITILIPPTMGTTQQPVLYLLTTASTIPTTTSITTSSTKPSTMVTDTTVSSNLEEQELSSSNIAMVGGIVGGIVSAIVIVGLGIIYKRLQHVPEQHRGDGHAPKKACVDVRSR